MTELILASSSPYRRILLERLGLPFLALSPDIDETPYPGETAAALVQRLAAAKAAKIADGRPKAVVIASDQVAVADGTDGRVILGKPGDAPSAVAQLTRLSGRRVLFLTSLCVREPSGSEQLETESTHVHFRELRKEEIVRYVELETPFDCAGSFRSEGLGIALFNRIEGDDPNALIGLPLIRLCRMLRQAGLDPLGSPHRLA